MRKRRNLYILLIFSFFLLVKVHAGHARGIGDEDKEAEEDTGAPVLQYQIFPELQYGNNSAFFGRSYGSTFPFSSTSVTFKHRTGLWVSGGLFQVFNTSNVPDQYSLSAGWMYDINNAWQLTLSYNHYFFQTRNLLLNSTSTNLLDAYLTYDWNILQTSFGTGYLFGERSDVYNVLSNSKYVFLHDSLISNYDMLYMEPAITFVAGTQNFSKIFTQFPVSGDNQDGDESTPELPGYAPLNLAVTLPVTYKYKQWYLELNGKFTVPLSVVENDPSKPRFIFNATVYYVINSYNK